MAAGTIISVLSNIPWGQVMETAPKVADGAAKLWNAVTRKKTAQTTDANAKTVGGEVQSEEDVLNKRLVAMEQNILSLQDQMEASTELLKALAEQNAQLVQRIELNSVRLFRLTTALAIGAVALVGTIAYLAVRS